MTTATAIHEQVKDYLSPGPYDVKEIDYVPEINDPNLTFGNKGVKLYASVLYIDMRGSTDVLREHHKYTVAKIQKAYLHIAVTVVKDNNGHVRSFNGDGILAFFPNNYKTTIRDAVKAAMQIKYMLTQKSKAEFERYHPIDFGIGIEYNEIFVAKVGLPKDPNNNDLTWIGLPVNTAVRLGDCAQGPRHIRISSYVYENLMDEVKYHDEEYVDPWGKKQIRRTNMWQSNSMLLHGQYSTIYDTSYHWTVSD